jgi:hypothetical protein
MSKLNKLMEMVDQEAPALTLGTDRTARDLWMLVLGGSMNPQNRFEILNDLVMLLSCPDSAPRTRKVLSWMLDKIQEAEAMIFDDPEDYPEDID